MIVYHYGIITTPVEGHTSHFFESGTDLVWETTTGDVHRIPSVEDDLRLESVKNLWTRTGDIWYQDILESVVKLHTPVDPLELTEILLRADPVQPT